MTEKQQKAALLKACERLYKAYDKLDRLAAEIEEIANAVYDASVKPDLK